MKVYSECPKCVLFEILICTVYVYAFVRKKYNHCGHLLGCDNPPFYKIITVESKSLLNVCYQVTYQR